jgi:hypothetical protein
MELPLDGTPLAFTLDFYEDVNKVRQWSAFSENSGSYLEPIEFKTLVAHIAGIKVSVFEPRIAPSRHASPPSEARIVLFPREDSPWWAAVSETAAARYRFQRTCNFQWTYNGLHDRCRRQTIPGNPPTKRIYEGSAFVANFCI